MQSWFKNWTNILKQTGIIIPDDDNCSNQDYIDCVRIWPRVVGKHKRWQEDLLQLSHASKFLQKKIAKWHFNLPIIWRNHNALYDIL